MLNVGYGNLVNMDKVVAIVSADSAPSKRIVTWASENNLLVDASKGRKTQSVIVMESNHVVLSAMTPETLNSRIVEGED